MMNKIKQNTQLILKRVLFFALVYTNVAYSEIRPQSTSRLVSTAGAGVGSILMEESNVLNPGSIAFFKNSSLYYQKGKLDNTDNSDHLGDSFSVIASDTKGAMKGSVSYFKAEAGFESQERISVTAASPGGKSSSVGITASQVKDNYLEKGTLTYKKYRTVNIGVSHIVSREFSFGIVVNDITKEERIDDLALIGFHYQLHQFIAVMGDLGTNYRASNINEKYLYRAAMQLTFLSDFFVRGGISRDLTNGEEKTTGLGLSWVQPKLTFDFAFQDIEKSPEVNSLDENQKQTTYREASFSISYRF